MQQRQLRLGDILDDYCPRERRVTNHAIVAMVDQDVKQTRCTTCDADHEYKHAKVPRQRRKSETTDALHAQVAAGAPKRVTHETTGSAAAPQAPSGSESAAPQTLNALVAAEEAERERAASAAAPEEEMAPEHDEHADDVEVDEVEEGPVHRPLIRATLPRTEGQAPPTRPAPDFTIRQPGGRQNRFHPRQQRGSQPFGNRTNGNASGGGQGRSMQGDRPPYGPRGPQRSRGSQGPSGAPGAMSRSARHQGHGGQGGPGGQGRKRSK